MFEAGVAVREAFFQNPTEARKSAAAALHLSHSRDVEYGAAFALATIGDTAERTARLVENRCLHK